MSQTSYSVNQAAAFAGMIGDIASPIDSRTYTAKTAVPIPFGLAVVKDSSGDSICRLPTALADTLVGIALATQTVEQAQGGSTPQYAALEPVPVLRKGRVWVSVEEAVDPTKSVFVRYATGIIDNSKTQGGAFRASADGAAQVATLTPTAADNTKFGVEIFNSAGVLVASVQIDSGVSATATTIVTALKAALGSPAGITVSGVATLILTSSLPGQSFSVQPTGAGVLAVAATTPNTQSAMPFPQAKYLTTAIAGGLALVDLNF